MNQETENIANNQTINVEHLPNGIYYLSIDNEGKSITSTNFVVYK